MRYYLVVYFALCCNWGFWQSESSDQQSVPKNYCTKLKSLRAVSSCDGGLVGQSVQIGTNACLLGQTKDGQTWLYVPTLPDYSFSFSEAQDIVDEGRLCLAPDANDFGIPIEGYPGIMFMPPGFFLRCDSPYCADPEGFPNWHYEPEAPGNNEHPQHMQQTSSNPQPPSPH